MGEDRVLLKTGEPHPELLCPRCNHAIRFDRQLNMWVCTTEKCMYTSKEREELE